MPCADARKHPHRENTMKSEYSLQPNSSGGPDADKARERVKFRSARECSLS